MRGDELRESLAGETRPDRLQLLMDQLRWTGLFKPGIYLKSSLHPKSETGIT